jgi:KipI family sensor histidine kinase inhibitor
VSQSGAPISASAIRDAGDSAFLLELEPVIDPAVNARAIGIANTLVAANIAGVRDIIPTYRSVTVHFDPLRCDVNRLRAAMRDAAATAPAARAGSLVEIPVEYGGPNGPDLEDVASFGGLTPDEVIQRHVAVEYRVFMLGFLPGFPYMGVVDDSIAAPRRAIPRTRIPAGSVGIAGKQTGIYPRTSPGGWHVIGRTNVELFDARREPASLFAPGDRVRFRRESHAEGSRIPLDSARGKPHPGSRPESDLGSRIPHPGSRPEFRFITVLAPGLFTTVQDSGRWGHQDRGVPVSGPMDRAAYGVANALIGNPGNAAVLEATLLGPELRFEHATRIAIAGADLSASVDWEPVPANSVRACTAGSVLRFGARRSGARAYIAFEGGIDMPPTLGSRATHVVSSLGGLHGRALAAGDQLMLGSPLGTVRQPPPGRLRMPDGGVRLRAVRGPQDEYFDDAAFDMLQRTRFTISPQSDRMGYHLRLPDPTRGIPLSRGAAPGSMISDATFTGGVQVPPSGEPILLMADRQTTGGYPQIAVVITADLPMAGQLLPGDWIEFEFCTRDEAIAALRDENEVLRAF